MCSNQHDFVSKYKHIHILYVHSDCNFSLPKILGVHLYTHVPILRRPSMNPHTGGDTERNVFAFASAEMEKSSGSSNKRSDAIISHLC